MVKSTVALLDRDPNPSEDEVRLRLAGNICRCTGYTKIIEAVMVAAKAMYAGDGEVK
jgi:carbon-monoxide dehydrogenase small subunit